MKASKALCHLCLNCKPELTKIRKPIFVHKTSSKKSTGKQSRWRQSQERQAKIDRPRESRWAHREVCVFCPAVRVEAARVENFLSGSPARLWKRHVGTQYPWCPGFWSPKNMVWLVKRRSPTKKIKEVGLI